MKEMLHFFGYAKTPQDPENATGFFEFDGSDEELTRQYMGYRAQNQAMVNWSGQLTDQDLASMPRYRLSNPAKEVALCDFTSAKKIISSTLNHYQGEFYGKTITKCD
mmetsp:Transcript_15269/g.20744  ORF Transcript_15269/g.20744 Transcript_15269/m.20744 type:complete len:107 (+) Transcript_15269:750-1070(+)